MNQDKEEIRNQELFEEEELERTWRPPVTCAWMLAVDWMALGDRSLTSTVIQVGCFEGKKESVVK